MYLETTDPPSLDYCAEEPRTYLLCPDCGDAIGDYPLAHNGPYVTAVIDRQPHPGFGLLTVLCDGAEPDWWRALSPAEVADVWWSEIEAHAKADPEHQWRLVVEGPLHGEVYERQGPGQWVIVRCLDGFA